MFIRFLLSIDIEDIFQNLWLRIWENPSFIRCNEKSSALPYLMQYVHYRIKDAFREKLMEAVSVDESILLESEDQMLFYDTITAKLDEEDLLNIIEQSFNERQVQAKKIFKLRLENYSVEETAKALSVSPRNVYNSYSRSLALVKDYIRDNYVEFSPKSEKKGKNFSLRSFLFSWVLIMGSSLTSSLLYVFLR